jgi:hypothetical protein
MSNIENIRQETLAVFKDTMMNKIDNMDTKMLNYWTNSITNNNKNIDDFKQFLLKSQDYNNLVRNTFFDIFYDKLSDKNYQELFNEFQLKYNGKQVQENDIILFISNSKTFVDKYTQIIAEMYELINSQKPSSEIITTYLLNFQLKPFYNIDNLEDDIKNNNIKNIEYETEEHTIVNNSTDGENLQHEDFTENEQKEIISLWNDKSLFLEFYRNIVKKTDTKTIDMDINILDIVNAFETIYDRNMNVREYLLYIKQLSNLKGPKLLEKIEELKRHHMDVFIKARDVVSRYLNETLQEDDFICKYLNDIDNVDFLDDLRQNIIDSDEYENKMSERLSSLYKNLYDEALIDADIKYIFDKVKKQGCDIQNEDLNNFIVEFKNETDHITERILKIYIDTYEREPDVYEVAKYIELYRKNPDKDIQEIDEEVEQELQDSLEYHDVIKSKIRKIYTSIKNINILPSIIYTLLEKVISNKSHNKDLDAHIEQLVQEI